MSYPWQRTWGVHVLNVASDTQETINQIVDDVNVGRPLMTLILDCRKMIMDFKKFKIQNVFRETNGVPDALAK